MALGFSNIGRFDGVGTADVLNNSTTLAFGPDGRLYVSEQNGSVNAFTVELQNGQYVATAHEELLLSNGLGVVKGIQNHDDDGSISTTSSTGQSINNRQVTGIVTAGTAENPVLYITSSDPRISQPDENNQPSDSNLDTNSGVLTKVTWNGTNWEQIDLIRGLPRSEENHAVNGMQLSDDGNTLYMTVGGNTNNGAPSLFFTYLGEYALSGTVLEVDLVDLESRQVQTDADAGKNTTSRQFIYDLQTLDDPTVPNDGVREDANGLDVNGPFGGNDGLNQAILTSDAPFRILADGFRNPYDLALSPTGQLYTVDNGSNDGVGGDPLFVNGDITNQVVNGGEGALEPLFLIEDGNYYGHPNPVRSDPSVEWIVYDDNGVPDPAFGANNTISDISTLVPSVLVGSTIQAGFLIDPSKFTGDPTRLAESGVRIPYSIEDPNNPPELIVNPASESFVNIASSSNGLLYYDSQGTAFDGALDGTLFVAQFNDNITALNLTADGLAVEPVVDPGPDNILGTADDFVPVGAEDGSFQLGGFDGAFANPLDVTIGPDGTLWVAEIGSDEISVWVPDVTTQPGDDDFDDDGILDINDPFTRDATNGTSVLAEVGQTYNWSFAASGSGGDFPGPDGYGGGLTGVMINNTVDFEDFFQEQSTIPGLEINLDNVKFNTAAGGGATIVENASNGDPNTTSNSGEFLFHTGISIDPTVESFNVSWSFFNPGSDGFTGDFQQIGGYIGTGDQSNYLKVVAIQSANRELQVTLENNDGIVSTEFLQADDLFDVTIADSKRIFADLDIDVVNETATPSFTYEKADNTTSTVVGTPVSLTGTNLLDAINGNVSVQGQTTGVALGLFSTNVGEPTSNAFQAIFDDITVTVADSPLPPDAVDDTATTGVNQPIVIPVSTLLANDTDPNTGDTITVTSVQNSVNGAAVLSDNGTPSDASDDFVTFTPTTDFAGTATFDYTVTDSTALTDTATVSIDVANEVVIYRVNAGGNIANAGGGTIAAIDGGIDWIDDSTLINSTGPVSLTGAVNSTFSNQLTDSQEEIDFDTADPLVAPFELFINERFDGNSAGANLTYNFDVVANETYKITLFYTENFQGIFAPTANGNPRQFDVAVEGAVPTEFDDIDPFAEAVAFVGSPPPTLNSAPAAEKQPYLGVAEQREFTVTAQDTTLTLEFLHGQSQNPKINGIQISQLSGPVSPPAPVVSVADTAANEGENAIVTFTRTGDDSEAITVTYAIADGTADSSDFTAPAGTTVVIPASQPSATISIPIIDDPDVESAEDFTVTITDVSNTSNDATIGTATGTVTIAESDQPGTIQIGIVDDAFSVQESGDDGTFTSILYPMVASDNFTGDVEITFDVNASIGETQVVSYVDGLGSLNVSVPNDDIDTGDTPVLVQLTAAQDSPTPGVNAFSFGNTTGTGTITEDDAAPLSDVETILAGLTDVDNDGNYTGGEVGRAELQILAGNNDVQVSNFGVDSFTINNTGDKEIAAVFIDFRDSLYGDSVVDLDGSAGDAVTKPFQVDSQSAAGTGAFFDTDVADTYFLPGANPLPNTTGTGQASTGGFRGLLLKFDGTSGGFDSGEFVGVSGDMDPNSIAGLLKSNLTSGVDIGAINNWDAGGISGLEVAGSEFTVLFDDGSTASGFVGSDGSLAGSVGEAEENRAEQVATVTVNGFVSGQAGTYGGTEPSIVVNGPANATVLVTLSKGLNPVTNTNNGVADLVSARLADAHAEFPVNNAADVQTFQVTLDGTGAATLPASAFDYNTPNPSGGESFAGSAFTQGFTTAPIVVGASVVDTGGQPLGPIDRVYLTNPTDTPVGSGGSNADPVITSASSASVVEGTIIALDVDATDADLDPITFGFGGGVDDALFAIDPSTGVLSFLAPPDFEAPGDTGGDNVYDVIVTADDGNNGTDTQAVQITVTDDPSDNGGSNTLTVKVGGNGTLPDNTPMYEVFADGVSLGIRSITAPVAGGISNFNVNDDSLYQLDVFQFSGPAPDNVEIVYFNDGASNGEPRNLIVDNMELNGEIFEAEVDGFFTRENGSATGEGPREKLFWNGTLAFDNLNDPSGPSGHFEIIDPGANARFKIQIEDPNIENGGTTPLSNWTYVAGDGANGNQTGTQGTGHYFWGAESSSDAVNVPQLASALEFNILVPEGSEGEYNFRFRASRDTSNPSDARNDAWLKINDDAEALQVNPANTVSNEGFVKVFGGATGGWGFAQGLDGLPDPNFTAVFNLAAGLHTITIAGRSQGFHIDYLEFFKGNAPNIGASDSNFVPGGGSNADPVITSASSASVVEGTTIALDVDATDADLDPITFGFGGGADDALFSIDPSTGVLSFLAPPDFEAPGDVGLNNVYDVIVSASDGNGGLDTQAVQITVTDDPSDNGSNADPVITSASSASVVEGTTIALDVDATDADLDPITFGFGGGADDALFAIDPSTGVLSFIAPPDFEAPGDVGNNVYDVIVSASDGNGGLDTQAVQITVTDDPSDNGSNADPVITSASSASVVEGTTIALDVDATDADLDPITFGFGGGADDALFSIDPSTGVLSFIAPPDFEAPGDVGLNNVYDVIVSASDGNGGLDTQAVQITVTDDPSDNGSNADPVITSASSASVVEGTTIALDVDATDADLDPITFGFGGGADDALFAIDPSTGVLSFSPRRTSRRRAMSASTTSTTSSSRPATAMAGSTRRPCRSPSPTTRRTMAAGEFPLTSRPRCSSTPTTSSLARVRTARIWKPTKRSRCASRSAPARTTSRVSAARS